MHIRLLTIAFFISSVWALHSTMPEKSIFYIPATNQEIKVRPAGFVSTSTAVVSLEEAIKRHQEKWGSKQPEAYVVDNSECWFNDCELEWTIRLAKFELVTFFSS